MSIVFGWYVVDGFVVKVFNIVCYFWSISCIGYFNNRIINSVLFGYSVYVKVDICNLEVLGEV